MNFTPTIGLSQYTADDETNWMGPVNADNLRIDQSFAERDQKTIQDDLKIETLQTNLTNLTTQVDHDTAEIDKLIAGADDTTKDITGIEERLTAEEDATTHMQQDISNLLSTQGEHSTDIENLTTRTDNLDTLTQQLSGDYTTLNNDVKQLDSDVTETNVDVSDLQVKTSVISKGGCVPVYSGQSSTVNGIALIHYSIFTTNYKVVIMAANTNAGFRVYKEDLLNAIGYKKEAARLTVEGTEASVIFVGARGNSTEQVTISSNSAFIALPGLGNFIMFIQTELTLTLATT